MSIEWTPITIKLGDLKPWDENPRMSSVAEAERILQSIKDFGQAKPINISPTNDVYDGHQRLSALLTVYGYGYELKAWRSSRHLTDFERRGLVMALHASAEGSWDWGKLADWDLPALLPDGFAQEWLAGLNYDGAMVATLLEAEGEKVTGEEGDAEPQIDKAAELQEKWATELGQLWQIGEHRLLIGDCTVAENVARLMGGGKARICFTSPPYTDQREYELGKFDWLSLMNGASDGMFLALAENGDALINLGTSHKEGKVDFYWMGWIDYLENKGHSLYGMYVWDKGSGFPGEWNGRLAPSHEFVFHFSNGRVSANKWIETTGESKKRGTSGKRFRQKDGSLKELTSPDSIGQDYKVPDSVIRVGREMARGIHTETHPAVYSVEFAEFGLKTWSNNQDICYEPFCGSGTTMVAAQNLGRKCYGMEISPAYGAVILERMITAFPDLDIYQVE